MRKKGIIGIALISVATLFLTSCATANADREDTKSQGSSSSVTLTIGDQVKSNQSILEAAGELNNLDYTINWATFESGPPLLEALGANKIDAGGTGDVPTVFAQANGSTGKIVATQVRDHSSDFLLVPQGSSARSLDDLVGKKIAVAQGTSAHGLLLKLIDAAGKQPSDFHISFLSPTDALAAFGAGQFDAWAIWDPYASAARIQNQAQVISDGQDLLDKQAYFSASNAAISDPAKAKALTDFLGRLARAQNLAQTHKEEWVNLYVKQTKLPRDVAEKTFVTSNGKWVKSSPKIIANQQSLIDTFAKYHIITSRPDAKDAFDDRLGAKLSE